MGNTDECIDLPLNGDADMGGQLPTGTVTLLLADVEGSTTLWEKTPADMAAAVATLDSLLPGIVVGHRGVRPVEQGEGDSFVVAFSYASDAVACALDLQRAPLAPIRLRIGVHAGEVQLRDEGNYIGPAVNRAARIRDLGHGGQTLLSGIAADLVIDRLPAGARLVEAGSHPLRGVPRPERVVQLCHADLPCEFPPLRTSATTNTKLPAQLTSFIGRASQIDDLRNLMRDNRIVTLTGAGGVGKTRLALEVAARFSVDFPDGVWYVDLASLTDGDLVPSAVARSLGLPDQPERSTTEVISDYIADRTVLVLLDNCEHLLDAATALSSSLVEVCGHVTFLNTSREPLGVPGEITWRVPSLSLGDEAVELFVDRARQVNRDFSPGDDEVTTVVEICRRLDGMPLAIELAAARVRALSLNEILGSLRDRFRLLTGGVRTAVRRQQTLRASVDWSHALLTEPERVLFRRLAAFSGGFDLEAAQAVAGAGEIERYQVLDQLTLLVDKSLVVAETGRGTTRYRMLETVRQYAQEKLGDSGEADLVRLRHRDHYSGLAAVLNGAAGRFEQRRDRVAAEMDNLRAAFTFSCEAADFSAALGLASALQPIWSTGNRLREGLEWFDRVLLDPGFTEAAVAPALEAQALADKAVLYAYLGAMRASIESAEQALTIARGLDDPDLLTRVLTASGSADAYRAGSAGTYIDEAMSLIGGDTDPARLGQMLFWRAFAAVMAEGDPLKGETAAIEGIRLADSADDAYLSRQCRWALALAHAMTGKIDAAVSGYGGVLREARSARDPLGVYVSEFGLVYAHSYLGDTVTACAAAQRAVTAAPDLGPYIRGVSYVALTMATLAAGDVEAAYDAGETAAQLLELAPEFGGHLTANHRAETALARGDVAAARRYNDEDVGVMQGWHLAGALTVRARIAIAEQQFEQAERDAHDALAAIAGNRGYSVIPDALECLALAWCRRGQHEQAARILGAAAGLREQMGMRRFVIYDGAHDALVEELRNSLGDNVFDTHWAEGAALGPEDAVAYAQRGRGERKRPSSGWESLTPAELDVARLVAEGLGNKEIAARLFISARTVQSHLTRIYAKLGITSRLQLAQEAARHA